MFKPHSVVSESETFIFSRFGAWQPWPAVQLEMAVFQHVFLVTPLPAEPGLGADGAKRCHPPDKNSLDDLARLRD